MIGRWLAAQAVLLPRPNPGPERWPGPDTGLPEALGLLGAALWLLLAAWWAWRRGRVDPGSTSPGPMPRPAVGSPLALWAARVRGVLEARLGPSLAAWTTEELADSPALAAWLGAERAAQLIRFLRAADRAKFAGDPIDEPEWTAWVAGWVADMADGGERIAHGE